MRAVGLQVVDGTRLDGTGRGLDASRHACSSLGSLNLCRLFFLRVWRIHVRGRRFVTRGVVWCASQAVPFKSPPSLERSLVLPNRGKVTGMGIPAGVSLIVGGG